MARTKTEWCNSCGAETDCGVAIDHDTAATAARQAHKALEQAYMVLKDEYSELARAIGVEGDAFWGDPLESHTEVLAKAKLLKELSVLSPAMLAALDAFPIRESQSDTDYLELVSDWWARKAFKAMAFASNRGLRFTGPVTIEYEIPPNAPMLGQFVEATPEDFARKSAMVKHYMRMKEQSLAAERRRKALEALFIETYGMDALSMKIADILAAEEKSDE